jgi:tetratricopeptide (TPR) repeat protein
LLWRPKASASGGTPTSAAAPTGAANVAQALSIALGQPGRAALTLGGTTDSVAQDLLLQARKLRREATGPEVTRKSLALLDAALARDPNYAEAYVAKADALNVLGTNLPTSPADQENHVALAEAAARRAAALAPKLGSAYAVLAYIDMSRQDFASSLSHLREALALSADAPMARFILT